jgi:hypothetical protein
MENRKMGAVKRGWNKKEGHRRQKVREGKDKKKKPKKTNYMEHAF